LITFSEDAAPVVLVAKNLPRGVTWFKIGRVERRRAAAEHVIEAD